MCARTCVPSPWPVTEAMRALGSTVRPQHSPRSGSCPSLPGEETGALAERVLPRLGGRLAAGGLGMPITWHHAGGHGSELARDSLCANNSALLAGPDSTSFEETNQGLQAAGQAGHSGRGKGTRTPFALPSLLVPEWDLGHLQGARRNPSGRAGLAAGWARGAGAGLF